MDNKLIQPRTLKGFRDFLPEDMRLRQQVINIIRAIFEKYGYEPLETPTLEYDDILTGKYGEDEKLMYRFKDHGEREVAMKYDLTVPAARVIAQYNNLLALPFKRYQIQPVWRADNTQRGRYRELWQCDADAFGSSSNIIEAEWMCIGIEAFTALGLNNIKGMINNRKLLDVLLKEVAQCTQEEYQPIATSLDKYDKIGWGGVISKMINRNVRPSVADHIKLLLDVSGDSQTKIEQIEQNIKDYEKGIKAIEEIKCILEYVTISGLDSNKIEFNPLIIRGLSYYTGIVWEWQSTDSSIGSLGGGGRYDNLIGSFIGQRIPSAGGSFGLERIIDILKEKHYTSYKNNIIFVCNIENSPYSIQVTSLLRKSGIPTLQYPDNVKLDKQIKYALSKNIPLLIIAGPDEAQTQTVTLKNLQTREQQTVQISDLIESLNSLLKKLNSNNQS